MASLAVLVGMFPATADESDRARLILSRATYGARPGELERVLAMGTTTWLDEQLHPERIDDGVLADRLSRLDNLELSTSELMRKYPRPSREEREARQKAREEPVRSPAERGERMRNGQASVLLQLSEAKLVRAVHSEAQLLEVMTDFWFNHFNVYARKNRNTLLALPSFERDAIRPHALGRFDDLLLATATHPAMLFYLDNWINTKDGFDPREAMRAQMGRGRGRRQRAPEEDERRREFGINENYARELMELHTLGVDGGYDQDDVVEVARALTGWSVVGPGVTRTRERQGGRSGRGRPSFLTGVPDEGEFFFNALAHDEGAKTVLGSKLDTEGVAEGRAVITMLSRHPATARFIAEKLAQKFVSDTPSDALVTALSTSFTAHDGDISEVLRTLFLSERFVEEGLAAKKVKTPLELVASAARETEARVVGAGLVRALTDLGMPLYMCRPPTGYDEAATAWLSAGSLLSRARFAESFASGSLPGVRLSREVEDVDATALHLASPGFQLQ